MKITKVEYVVNPVLIRKFEKKRLEMATRLDWEGMYLIVQKKRRNIYWTLLTSIVDTKPILCFHGTGEANINKIIVTNFDVSKVGSSTDAGYYGAGIYFSEFPSLSMSYTRGALKFLLCQVLVGQTYVCPGLIMGAKKKEGYDSHQSPDKSEIVIFDSDQILPYYIVHFQMKAGAAAAGWAAPAATVAPHDNKDDDYYDFDADLPSD